MKVHAFFDSPTHTLTYVVWDPASHDAVVIDPVLDFAPLTWRVTTHSADEVANFVREHDLDVRWVLDTHAHADHLTGMEVLKSRLGASTGIGAPITAVQQVFAGMFGLTDEVAHDGSQFDTLIADGQRLDAGSFEVEAIHTPGHTPACMSFKIADMVFVGDTLFMPDYGTGRCDFPRGSASDLYTSITEKLYTLPDATRLFVGHDYQPNGRALAYETTVAASKADNIQLNNVTTRDDFIAFREARDATLAPPQLILQSLQVNIRAGQLPPPDDQERRFFKMPINVLGR